MFKQKHEKIDFNYLTWHNLLRVYEKYKNEDNNDSSFISTTRDSLDSSFKFNLTEEISSRDSILTIVNEDRRVNYK